MGDEFWTDFLTIFFLGISAIPCTSGHEQKNPPQNVPPHLCRIRGVSEAGSPQYHSRVRGWGTPAIDQTACAISCQQWEGAKLGWVVSFVSIGRWQLFKGNTCRKQNCNNIIFCGSLRFCWFKSRAYAGDSLWKVRGLQKYHKIPPPRNSATAQHQNFAGTFPEFSSRAPDSPEQTPETATVFSSFLNIAILV